MADITEENGGMIGGYTYNQKHFNQQLIHTIAEILAGKQARDIPFYIPTDGAPIINYKTYSARDFLLPCVHRIHISWTNHYHFGNKMSTLL